MHRIALTRGGALCLLDHDGGESIITALSGEKCRCQEVRELWQQWVVAHPSRKWTWPSKRLPNKLLELTWKPRQLHQRRQNLNEKLEKIDHTRRGGSPDRRHDISERLQWRAGEVAAECLAKTTYKLPPMRSSMTISMEIAMDNLTFLEAASHEEAAYDKRDRSITHIERDLSCKIRPVNFLRTHLLLDNVVRQPDGTMILAVGTYEPADIMLHNLHAKADEVVVVCGRQFRDATFSIRTADAVVEQGEDGIWEVVRWLKRPEEDWEHCDSEPYSSSHTHIYTSKPDEDYEDEDEAA
jgi:hypothetical protein